MTAGSSALKAVLDPKSLAGQKTPLKPVDTKDPAFKDMFDPKRIRESTSRVPAKAPGGSDPKKVETQTFKHNPEDSRFLVPSRLHSNVLRPEGRNSPAAITDIERMAQQQAFSGQKSQSAQGRSASTFSKPESAHAPSSATRGLTQRVQDGAGRAADAIRGGFQSGAQQVKASFYGRGDNTAGRRTASGRIFNPNEMTFAQPLGSGRLGGTYQICSQFRCVEARATDYGNFGPGNKYQNRGADLSAGLFGALGGSYGRGLLQVAIKRIR